MLYVGGRGLVFSKKKITESFFFRANNASKKKIVRERAATHETIKVISRHSSRGDDDDDVEEEPNVVVALSVVCVVYLQFIARQAMWLRHTQHIAAAASECSSFFSQAYLSVRTTYTYDDVPPWLLLPESRSLLMLPLRQPETSWMEERESTIIPKPLCLRLRRWLFVPHTQPQQQQQQHLCT